MTIVVILAVLLIAPTYLNRLRKYPTLFTLVVMLMFSTIVLLELNYANAENRVRVAVIDTGIDSELATPYLCKDGNKDFTGKGMKDVSGHGTNVAGIISKKINRKIFCLQIIKWYHSGEQVSDEVVSLRLLNSLKQALKFKPRYVNLSMAGYFKSSEEQELLTKLVKNGAKVFVAAGNEGKNLNIECDIYPACYDIHSSNYYVIGNYSSSSSNYANWLKWENGDNVEGFGLVKSGTSQATAVYLSKQIQKDLYE